MKHILKMTKLALKYPEKPFYRRFEVYLGNKDWDFSYELSKTSYIRDVITKAMEHKHTWRKIKKHCINTFKKIIFYDSHEHRAKQICEMYTSKKEYNEKEDYIYQMV